MKMPLRRSKVPLFLLIFSSIFNIGLDIYFVCRLHMEVAGVAWATLIAQGIFATVALPSILQQSTVSIGMLLVQSVVNTFGSKMLVGYSAASRVESICIVPLAAMGNAISSYAAQNIGAKQFERVKQGYHVGYGVVISVAV